MIKLVNIPIRQLFASCLLFFSCVLQAQSNKNATYFEPHYMVGKIVPNYIFSFPPTSIQQALVLDVGTIHRDTSNVWAKYYQYPETGIRLFYSNLGENHIFGNQVAILPFISFKVLRKSQSPWRLKLGLGASYFSTFYDSIENPRNKDIGSTFTWAFQASLYKTIYQNNGLYLSLNATYSHGSNGHTQLPNLGINSGLLGISAQFYKKQPDNLANPIKERRERHLSSFIFIAEKGIGFHEFGHRDFPVGGTKFAVHSTSIGLGKVLNHHQLIKAGLTHRYYNSYYDYITTTSDPDYIDQPRLNASAIELFLGSEFYMGHVSMDVYLGANVYKPFYKRFGELFKERTQIEYQLKRIFATRLGINFYLINTSKKPRNNLYLGPHIKANLDQADFTELVIGYQYRLK